MAERLKCEPLRLASLEAMLKHFEAVGGGLGSLWGLEPLVQLLEYLGLLFGLPGALLEASWSIFGRSWGGLGASWPPLGPSLGALGGVLGPLGHLLGRLGGDPKQ